MEQHPVPQQISSYQFRLVGDMTLKQFFELAGGALVSLLIYATGLPGLIKWPLIIFFAAFGAALAFLPFEERPLEQWLVAFFRSVYSPTHFYWDASATPTQYFQPEPAMTPQAIEPKEAEEEKTGQRPPALLSLEKAENVFLTKVSSLFKASPLQVQPVTKTSTPQAPEPAQPKEVVVPQVEAVQPIVPGVAPRLVVEEEKPIEPIRPETVAAQEVMRAQAAQNIRTAQFSPEAAPPAPPTTPNTIVGQVMDPDGGIIEGAILEVKDSFGRPVRALKTNKVGHFMVVTALATGKYELFTEKEGYVFDPVSFEAKGEIIPPIAIRASARSNCLCR